MNVLCRIAIALGVLVPYVLLPIARPIWLTFTVAFVAFGAGHLVAGFVKQAWLRAALATLAVAAGGISLLVWPRRAGAETYAEAAAVAAAPGDFGGRRFKMHGKVDAGTLAADGQGGKRFKLSGVAVAYDGPLPDQFRELTEVVVTGRLEGGVFQAETLLAKCPDRYRTP